MMLVPYNLEQDKNRFEKLFTQEECQNIRPVNKAVLEIELAGLANNTVLRKNFESLNRQSCESILTFSGVRLLGFLDSLSKKNSTQSKQGELTQSMAPTFKISKLSDKLRNLKLTFKKTEVKILPIQHATFDPEHPTILLKDKQISGLEADLEKRDDYLQAQNLKIRQLERQILLSAQEKTNHQNFEDYLGTLKQKYENIKSGERDKDPLQDEIDELIHKKKLPVATIQTKGIIGGLLGSIRKQDNQILTQKPCLDEIFTLFN